MEVNEQAFKSLKIMGIVFLIVFILILLISSISIIPTGSVGIKTRFGKVQDTALEEGLHLKIPFIESVKKLDCKTTKVEVVTEGSSKDLQKISNTKITVNYSLNKGKAVDVYKEIGKDYEVKIVHPAIEDSIKQGMSEYTADELITKRSEVSSKILNVLKEKLEDRGINIEAVNIIDLSFSAEFDKAIEEKQIVEQQTQKAKYELEKAKVENETKIENAKAEAKVMEEQNSQITDKFLKLKELENMEKIIEKWNGVLPTTTTDTIPFLNIN